MGTTFSVRVWAHPPEDPCLWAEKAIRAVEETESRLSTWRQDSELSALNRAPTGQAVQLSPELCNELSTALRWAAETGGAFDPTVGALIRAYDLRGPGRWPSQQELEQARKAVGFTKLRLESCLLSKNAPDVVLEEGAFGKGAALDAALAAVRGKVEAVELNLGGQVSFWGKDTLAVDLVHPDHRGEVVATWILPPGSVATSGNAERGRTVDGKPLGHLLDPRSGRPAEDFGSVAVWAADGLTADCLSTALFVLGPEQSLRILANHREVAAVFLVREGRGLRLLTTPHRAKLVPKASRVRVAEIAWPQEGQREEKP
ncbi:MAG: FAD:protein FMN transferase [Thermoanaerobaculum sp.]